MPSQYYGKVLYLNTAVEDSKKIKFKLLTILMYEIVNRSGIAIFLF